MLTAPAVEGIILHALTLLNNEFAEGNKIKVDNQTLLFGPDAQIDSLSLVSLIVDIEGALNSEYNLSISLTDDRAMTREISPFTDVQALKTYILELTGEAK